MCTMNLQKTASRPATCIKRISINSKEADNKEKQKLTEKLSNITRNFFLYNFFFLSFLPFISSKKK